MRAIVTGGAGFIGSHVVDLLVARGDEVFVLDDLSRGKPENVNEGAELVVADIRDPDAVGEVFGEARPEACFHLAAQADVRVSVQRPDFDAEVNVLGTLRLLEAAREHGTRIVFASTGGAIYGECAKPALESAPRAPLSQYGTSKLAGEEYLATYNRLYGSEHTSLRFGNVYGPRQDPHGEAGVYNVGTGVATSVLDLFEACGRAAGVEVEPVFDPPRLGELQRSVLDPGLATRELGFATTTSFADGITATWKFLTNPI